MNMFYCFHRSLTFQRPMTSTRLYISELGNGRMDRVEFAGGYFSLVNASTGYADISARSYVLDYPGSVRAVCDGESGKLLESIDYMPSGLVFGRMNHDMPHRRFFCGKEELPLAELKLYDSTARLQDAYIPRFTTMDPLAEKYYHISPYAYCGNNPVNRIDPDGREWKYVVDANGHITINVALNLSVSGDYTAAQISAYKNAISTQFHNTIYESSGGTMSGTITFYQGNQNITQSLSLSEMDGAIGGRTSYFHSSVNLFNRTGELRPLSDIGSDAIHEILHTVRLAHPFELTQTEDTKLVRVAPNTFVSTPTTDINIINNVMNYPMITIDGQKSTNQNSLTKGQLDFILKEINLQNQGYGFFKYNPALTQEQNLNLYKQYYESYWHNIPGTPVGNK